MWLDDYQSVNSASGGANSADPALPGLPGLAGASGTNLGGLAASGGGAIGSLVAGLGGLSDASGIAKSSSNIAALQQQMNSVKWNQTQLNFNRSQLQNLRNAQQGRSVALANASGSGAQFGSALGGGLGNISGEAGTTAVSLSQNEQNAQQEYNINQSIGSQEQQISKYQGDAAMWAGIGKIAGGLTSFGTSLVGVGTN
jgi:hypothetical protein